MKLNLALLTSVVVLAASASLPAQAALLNFNLTGSKNATFQLDSNPTPDFSSTSVFGDQIQFFNVSGTFDGVAMTAPSIGFGSGLFASLNINGTPLGFTQFAGPTLFSGTDKAPIFAPGTFALTGIVSGNSTLTISEVAAGVPEPTTWALMIGGFGLTGLALRRRGANLRLQAA